MKKNEAAHPMYLGEIVDLKTCNLKLTESILVYISQTRFFPQVGFVREQSK